MENNQSAQRAARTFLADRVRNDWDWPQTPEYWSASDEEVRGITDFRERYYGASTPESESEAEPSAAADPYQFDSPDTIGETLEQKQQSRKCKRRAAMQSEMQWNTGLATFARRRDAWTGAAAVQKYGTNVPAKDERKSEEDEVQKTADNPSSPQDQPPESDDFDPVVPVAHPLLPDNPIRTSITPKVYPDIFNNIVVIGRAPAVPVNLADMTRALVLGWQENGEWPPKAAPLDPLAGKKRALAGIRIANGDETFLAHHPHVKKGMDSVKRIFHLNGHSHETPPAAGKNG